MTSPVHDRFLRPLLVIRTPGEYRISGVSPKTEEEGLERQRDD